MHKSDGADGCLSILVKGKQLPFGQPFSEAGEQAAFFRQKRVFAVIQLCRQQLALLTVQANLSSLSKETSLLKLRGILGEYNGRS